MTVATLKKQSIANEINGSIAPSHYQEWRKSGVSDKIIRANVRTLYDQLEVDKLLNKRTKKLWHRPEDLVPCWAATGIDPLTDMPTVQGVQVKPNVPRINEKGKAVKYESARDAEASPLFLDTGYEGFWPSVLEDITQKIFITEGAKKAGALLSNGYAGVSIPGVSTCRKRGRLHQNLEIFAKVGRSFYVCFDNDLLAKKPVQEALKGLGAALKFFGSVVMIVQMPTGEAKGVDDYIAAFGVEAFQLLVDNALTIQEWVDEINGQEPEDEDIQLKSRLARHYNLIKDKWGEHLRLNKLKKQVELNGEELDEDEVKLEIANKFDIDICSADAQMIIRNLAKQDAYSPVEEYLDEVESKFPDVDTNYLDNLAEQYFGTNDPIHSIYFKKFLVASVARARQPGCKVDSVFMLMSPEQGKYKSTFFSVLFGEDFFSDQLGTDIGNKDEKMKISQYWCLEWAEFEAIYRRKDVSALKNFITNREDTFRSPYARKDAKHPRPCVFVGTSNEKEILHDPTGDRRFWIVPVLIEKIPLATVRANRDKIWATANALYKSGYQWWLLDSEELVRAERNKEYQETSYWDEVIEQLWIEQYQPKWLSTESIAKRLGFDTAAQMKPGDNNQLKASMIRLGFQKKTNRVDGSQRRGWEKVEKVLDNSDESTLQAVTGVTSLPSNGFSSYTPVTPPVTGVTEKEQNKSSVTPVTPPVTETSQVELLPVNGFTPVTPVTGVLEPKSENSEHLKKEPTVSGEECNLIDGVVIDQTITANGFYLGQLVQINHHPKRDDWIGKQGRITAFGHEYARISGDMSAKFGDVSPVECDRTQNTSDCWYTPDNVMQLVTDVLTTIDLDPCADDGKHIKASQHFTFADDGLSKTWGGRVFMNPPYSKPSAWIDKLQQEFASGRVTEAIALVPASTDTNWLHPLLHSQLVCFWKGRIKFLDVSYQPKSPARQSHCLIYWGNNPERFREVFAAYGAFNKDTEVSPIGEEDKSAPRKKKIDNEPSAEIFNVGDQVLVTGGKLKGKFGVIKYFDGGIWIMPTNPGKGIPTVKGPYFAHELEKV